VTDALAPVRAALQRSGLSLRERVDEELRQRTRRTLLGSLHRFVQHFWCEVEAQAEFKDGWHIRAICEHLEAVSRGEIENLLINVPPGTSKSTLVSVMWPAWEWASRPGLRYFGASYSEPISIRDAMLCRDVVTSPEYQRLFPEVTIDSAQNQKTHYALTSGGWRVATSVGGRGTGLHPHRKIVDDPHNVKQSESDAERQAALDWFSGTLSSRGKALNAATVVIMQRLHEKDLSGYIMSGPSAAEWEVLVLPMEYEPARKFPVKRLPFKDPRTREGELLWPALYDARKVATLQTALGEYRTAGQLQQRPAPAGGGILKRDKFRLWPADRPVPPLHFVLQSYDTAFTEDTNNDPSANTTWGVFEYGGRNHVMLLECWADHLTYPVARKRLMDDWRSARYGGDKTDPLNKPRRADVVLIEEKGSGISLLQDLRLANLPIKGYNPGKADKTARAHMASPFLDQDIVWVLESKRDKGEPVKWARPFLEQCEQFPNAEHDDMVDTFTQAIIYLRDADQLELPAVPDEQPEEVDYVARRNARQPENVYSL
jgi:predicted phage terminase large subunit-like protein